MSAWDFSGIRGEVLLHTLEQSDIYVSNGSLLLQERGGKSHVLKVWVFSDKDIERSRYGSVSVCSIPGGNGLWLCAGSKKRCRNSDKLGKLPGVQTEKASGDRIGCLSN
jgi:hypothetical protein